MEDNIDIEDQRVTVNSTELLKKFKSREDFRPLSTEGGRIRLVLFSSSINRKEKCKNKFL